MGLGGVMLGSSEWAGGLRDRHLPILPEQRAAVDSEINATLERVITTIFPYHNLASPTACAATSEREQHEPV